MEGRPVNVTFSSCVWFVLFSGLLSLCILFLISGFLLLLSLSISLLSLSSASSSSSSVLCLWFYHVLSVVPFLFWFFVRLPLVLEAGCWRLWRRWSTPVLVSALSSDGLSLRLLCSSVLPCFLVSCVFSPVFFVFHRSWLLFSLFFLFSAPWFSFFFFVLRLPLPSFYKARDRSAL